MNTKRLKLFYLVTLLLVFNFAVAQQVVTSAVGQAKGSEGLVSYTIGQTAYSSYESNTVSIHEGVQQPIEMFQITNVGQDLGFNLECNAYPNPTTQYLILDLNNKVELSKNISIRLYDCSGKLVVNQQVYNEKTRINTQKLQPGPYVLNVIANNGLAEQLSSFQIIKK